MKGSYERIGLIDTNVMNTGKFTILLKQTCSRVGEEGVSFAFVLLAVHGGLFDIVFISRHVVGDILVIAVNASHEVEFLVTILVNILVTILSAELPAPDTASESLIVKLG